MSKHIFSIAIIVLGCTLIAESKSFVPEEQVVCENDKLFIDCGNEQKIKIVQAHYGRRVKNHHQCGPGDDTRCSLSTAVQTVKTRCETQNSCEFKVNKASMKSDPCKNSSKYLEVLYKCV